MAEFPYPEYRNLWTGSAPSKDRSAVTDGTYRVTSEQISDGLRLTVNEDIPTSTSLLGSTTSFRPTIQPGMHWWSVTFRNPGSTPFPVSFGSRWFSATGSQVATSSISTTYLAPGETRTFDVGRDADQDMVSTGFWLYYSSGSTKRPKAGDMIEILDGITLVEGDTAPPFPFNGDGAKPVETIKRRNLAINPSFENGTDGWVSPSRTTITSDTWNRMEGQVGTKVGVLTVGSGYSSAYADVSMSAPFPVTPGEWVAVRFWAATEQNGERVRARIWLGDSDGSEGSTYSPSSTAEFYPGTYVTHAYRVSSGRVTARVGAQMIAGDTSQPLTEGKRLWLDQMIVAVADTEADALDAVSSYFDGDTAPSGNLSYRWAPDGTSLEVETIQPPTGRTTVWDGEPYKSTSTLWVGPASGVTGVMDVGISTEARLGIVSDVYSRSREKIQLELARVDSQLIAGERVELDAAAMTASPVVWHWRQITGPAVELEPREASMDFIAPDVNEDTPLRIAVYAASEDGRNRSDWHYFDLTIKPPIARFRATEGAFSPVSPKYVGYDRGKREVWNDVIPPSGFSPNPRHEVEILDLGIVPDDVQFTTGGPPERAAAGGIYVDLETGDIYRNFGAGYNETDDTTAAPRTNAWWVNPATGDILEWIED